MNWERIMAAYRPERVRLLARAIASRRDNPLGFRPAGSPAGKETVRFLGEVLTDQGVTVERETFPVDAWIFGGASLTPLRGEPLVLSSFGGSAGIELTAPLADAGDGTAEALEGRDLSGTIALVEMDFERLPWFSAAQRQVAHRGARAVVFTTKNRYATSPDALLAWDLQAGDSIPAAHARKKDFLELRARTGQEVHLSIRAEVRRDAGTNLIATLPGRRLPEQQVILADHVDAWFDGFTDDALGAATCVEFLGAVLASGERPERTLRVILHDAEEYGRNDTRFDWLQGSWATIRHLHRDWIGRTVGALVVELHGDRREEALMFDASPDLKPLMDAAVAGLPREGPYRPEATATPPRTWTDAWSYAREGVPASCNWNLAFMLENPIYHTPFDREEVFDEERNRALAGVYARALTALDGRALPALELAEWPRLVLARGGDGALGDLAGRLETALQPVDALARSSGDLTDHPEKDLPRLDAMGRQVLALSQFLHQRLLRVGGEALDEPLLPFEQPVRDLLAVEAAHRSEGPRARREALLGVTAARWSHLLDDPVAELELWRYAREVGPELSWAEGRLEAYLDVRPSLASRRGAMEALLEEARSAAERGRARTLRALEEALRWTPVLEEVLRGGAP